MTLLEYLLAGVVGLIIIIICISICIISGEISREEEYSEWERKNNK